MGHGVDRRLRAVGNQLAAGNDYTGNQVVCRAPTRCRETRRVSEVWMSGVFAAVFAVMALFFTVRLLGAGRETTGDDGKPDRTADVSHGVMSLGMAAMFSPWGNPVPALYWQVLFGMAAAWFAVRLFRRGADLHHLLGNLAMVYMLAAVPAGHHITHGADLPGPGIAMPGLAWAFVGYFLTFAVWLGTRLVAPVSTLAATSAGAAFLDGPRGVVTSPHLHGCSRIVMGIGMSCMLVTML